MSGGEVMTMVEITCFSCGEVKLRESATWPAGSKPPYEFPVITSNETMCENCEKLTPDVMQAYKSSPDKP